MKKIKVLHFELDEHLGGIESFLLNLYAAVDRDRFQFEFVTAVEAPALKEQLEELGGVIHYVAPHKKPLAYQDDIRRLLKSGFDVVHIHKNSAANIIPLTEARRAGIRKIFVHSHNTSPSTGKISYVLHKLNQNKLLRLSNRRFACSTEAGKWLYGNARFATVHNGIITENFLFQEDVYAAKREELGVGSDEVLIGHVGRFSEQKNHVFLLDIFKEMLKMNRACRLMLVGDGELRNMIEQKAKGMGISDRIIFTGLRNDIPQLMQAMDMFLMPSLYEGLPIVAIEAQASGVPIFLSDTVSPETELTDGIKWFSLNQSAGSIAASIMNGFAKSDLKQRRDRNAHVIKQGYDIKSTARIMQKYYEKK